MSTYQPIDLPDRLSVTDEEMVSQAEGYFEFIKTRHSVRDFSSRSVPKAVIEAAIRAAGTAPSGANHQPWHFVCVSDPTIKRSIRQAAEVEDEWLKDLAPLGTDEQKSFLETAPWLIAIFIERQGKDEQGNKRKNYYMPESVGIATGFLINALHAAGLATLTHTPNPMKFLSEILERPPTERPYLLLVVGHPAEEATVPTAAKQKKTLKEISTFREDNSNK